MHLFRDFVLLSRLHRPIGIWLLLFPAYAGLFILHQPFPSHWWWVILLGSITIRSAGCIYNDIIDRKIDAQVDRTRSRPLARSLNPLSLKWAIVFLMFNLSIALGCLFLLPITAWAVGIISAVMILLYPLMKRWTYWPQLFLGFTMNMGILMSAFSVSPHIYWQSILLYAGAITWTLGYDTIYGFQDLSDDMAIGVKSTTMVIKDYPKSFLGMCYVFTLCMWTVSGLSLLPLMMIMALLAWQVWTLQPENAQNCLLRFKTNQWVGFLLWMGALLS
jgi:4-hydroxybenzoate polyprenyltransferase